MLKHMYKSWWKILAALLVGYSLTIGILTPVGPGIQSIMPRMVFAGDTATILITGYNSHFAREHATLQVWLRHNGFYICPDTIVVHHDNHAEATFRIPANLPAEHMDKQYLLVANNDRDGSFASLHSVDVRSKDPGGNTSTGAETISCDPSVARNKPTFISFPYRQVLYETIRNLYFHVPMWFGMTALLLISFIFAIGYLRSGREQDDTAAAESVHVALLFGLLGFATGSLWGNYTWGNLGDWVLRDTKVLGALIGILMYLAYFVLRGSIADIRKRGRISAVYNIFCFVMYIVFIFVLPRMPGVATLHPGSGGNPAFNIYDQDSTMRLVFYPAVIGWIGIGLWIASLRIRQRFLENTLNQ